MIQVLSRAMTGLLLLVVVIMMTVGVFMKLLLESFNCLIGCSILRVGLDVAGILRVVLPPVAMAAVAVGDGHGAGGHDVRGCVSGGVVAMAMAVAVAAVTW